MLPLAPSVRGLATAALVLLIAGLLLLGCGTISLGDGEPAPRVAPNALPVAEPPEAAAFLAAYAHADLALADQVASPLYTAEWERLGLSLADRRSLLPSAATNPGQPWIQFAWVGGAVDRHGFGHWLYSGRPVESTDGNWPSVWRVDTDPVGRVIWLELVYLFSLDATDLAVVPAGTLADDLPLPPSLAKLHPRLIAGVRSRGDSEGYYALSVPATSESGAARMAPASVVFLGVDEEGGPRSGAWSYGRVTSWGPEGGRRPTPVAVVLPPELAALDRAYVAALCAGC